MVKAMPSPSARRIHIGTSGWSYPHWKGPFYPPDMTGDEMLGYYAGRFETVEINNSFYRLPEAQTLASWARQVPEDFVFAVKASRFITHMKKLREPALTLPPFLERMEALGRRLGPILFQLPPRWRCDVGRLEALLERIGKRRRVAFELRDPSWFSDAVYRALGRHGAAFCIYELDGRLSPREVTADFVYLRLHGPDGAYRGSYDHATLAGWAGAFSAWAAQGKEVYCYFDNDQDGYAALNAQALRHILDG